MDEQAYQERLLKDAWIQMSPKTIGREIDMGMALIGCQDQYFKFKTLTPLYPTMSGKLKDPDFYEDLVWDLDQSKKDYKEEAKDLHTTVKIFKLNQDMTKEQIMVKYKNLPDNFETIYDHLKEVVFVNKNFDPDLFICGKLWLRELFLQAQNVVPSLNFKAFGVLSLLMTCSYFVTLVATDYVREKNGI